VIWPITPFSSVLQQNFPKIKIHHTFFAANRPAILVKQRAKDVVQIITKLYPSVQNFLFFFFSFCWYYLGIVNCLTSLRKNEKETPAA